MHMYGEWRKPYTRDENGDVLLRGSYTVYGVR